jgi:hypothetical protein
MDLERKGREARKARIGVAALARFAFKAIDAAS